MTYEKPTYVMYDRGAQCPNHAIPNYFAWAAPTRIASPAGTGGEEIWGSRPKTRPIHPADLLKVEVKFEEQS